MGGFFICIIYNIYYIICVYIVKYSMKKIFAIIMSSILLINTWFWYNPTDIDQNIIDSVKLKIDEIGKESRDKLLKLQKSLDLVKNSDDISSRNRYIMWELLNYTNNKLNQVPEGIIKILNKMVEWDENDASYTQNFFLDKWEYKVSANFLDNNTNKLILASTRWYGIKTLISTQWPAYSKTVNFNIEKEGYYIFNIQSDWYRNLYLTKWSNPIDRVWIIQDN